MGYVGREYFGMEYEKRQRAWQDEQTYHRGWQAGYRQGSRDMERAYGRQMDPPRQKKGSEGTSEEDEGVPGPVELRCTVVHAPGEVCNYNNGEHRDIIVANFPPFK